MPPLTEEGERFAPRATWSCIDEPPKSAGRSRSASLPSSVKGRAWRHRLLRAPGMSNAAALRPCLKLPGCLMSLTALLPPPGIHPTLLKMIPPVRDHLLAYADAAHKEQSAPG